jgi:peroxiredoxin
MRHLMFVPVLLVLLVLPTQTQENRTRINVSQLGPQVGDRVPEFTLLDQTGKAQSLQSIMGRRGAMLVFVRSADW